MNKIRIHYFQHVPFEGLAGIGEWAVRKGHLVAGTMFFEDHVLPNQDSYDWLIIMGGPMSVNDEAEHPWLVAEKAFIREAIVRNKTIVGVCLGSQLIASALGRRVYPNTVKEIGWWPIENAGKLGDAPSVFRLTAPEMVFHWHVDTFDMPEGAVHLYRSDICINQGFLLKNNVIGLQFHFEVTRDSIMEMVSGDIAEIEMGGIRVQSRQQIIEMIDHCHDSNQIIFRILDYLATQ